MNYDENLTYDWLKNLCKKKPILNEDAANPAQQNPSENQMGPPDVGQVIANRALIAYQNRNKWYYTMDSVEEAKPSPSVAPEQGHGCDCTGFTVWAWGVRGTLVSNSVRVQGPGLGFGIWYDQCCPDIPPNAQYPKGKKYYGHSGIIVKMYPDGDFDSVDCSSSQKTLRYVRKARSWWQNIAKGKEVEFYQPKSFPQGLMNAPYVGDPSGLDGIEGISGAFQTAGWREHFKKSLGDLGIPDKASFIGGEQIEEKTTYEWFKILRENAGPSTSERLSDIDIAKLLYDVGFRDEDLVTMTRIVIGESNGVIKATGVNSSAEGKYKDSKDRGLFQFNSYAFSDIPDEVAYNPIKAAKEAYRVYKKMGFNPWKGKTKFHTLKADGTTPDTSSVERAAKAVQSLTGYKSTGNFEYIPPEALQGLQTVGSSWRQHFKKSLEMLGIPDKIEIANLSEDALVKKKIPNIKIKNKSKHKELMKNKELLIDMLSYFSKKLKFDKPVKINFIDDQKNSKNALGKTAYYHPEEHEITVFTTNRLLKDILRSIGHELIHHKQHCKQPFDMSNHQEGYAQKDKSMRKKEKEAYLYGNIIFRDWEDNYKANRKTKNDR